NRENYLPRTQSTAGGYGEEVMDSYAASSHREAQRRKDGKTSQGIAYQRGFWTLRCVNPYLTAGSSDPTALLGRSGGLKESTDMNEHEALTPKQVRTILCLLEARSFEEGCKRARAANATVYRWLRQNSFRKELEARRKEMVELAFENLKANATKAVQTLVKHLESEKGTISIRAAESILELARKDPKQRQ